MTDSDCLCQGQYVSIYWLKKQIFSSDLILNVNQESHCEILKDSQLNFLWGFSVLSGDDSACVQKELCINDSSTTWDITVDSFPL